MLNNVKLAPISAFCNGFVFMSSCLFFVKVGHDWRGSRSCLAGKWEAEEDNRLGNSKMASRQWFQARGYCQSRHYLWICHQPAWCLAAMGAELGTTRHLHVLPWPSSDWVITLDCSDNSTVLVKGEEEARPYFQKWLLSNAVRMKTRHSECVYGFEK